jgi:glutamate/tyrosine decarboxylase-like PLP-dependent enzyme
VIDPHKGLFTPYGSGALLVRDWRTLYAAHAHDAAYMRDLATLGDGSPISQLDMSPELTRPFRGLRLWLPLMLAGAAPFRAALAEKLLLARHLHQRLAALPGIEVGPEPDLSIVTFRAFPAAGAPDGDELDAFNRELAERIQRDGRIFLSSTLIGGRVTLRLAVLNVHVHLDHIERAIDVIDEMAQRLRNDGNIDPTPRHAGGDG